MAKPLFPSAFYPEPLSLFAAMPSTTALPFASIIYSAILAFVAPGLFAASAVLCSFYFAVAAAVVVVASVLIPAMLSASSLSLIDL